MNFLSKFWSVTSSSTCVRNPLFILEKIQIAIILSEVLAALAVRCQLVASFLNEELKIASSTQPIPGCFRFWQLLRFYYLFLVTGMPVENSTRAIQVASWETHPQKQIFQTNYFSEKHKLLLGVLKFKIDLLLFYFCHFNNTVTNREDYVHRKQFVFPSKTYNCKRFLGESLLL